MNTFEIDIDINNNPASKQKDLYAFNVSANYRDDVKSKRIPDYDLPEDGLTWSRSIVNFETKKKLDEALVNTLDKLTKTFVDALLFENGRDIGDEKDHDN